jgi:hypothetical protein
MPVTLEIGDKFVILALDRCPRPPAADIQLSDGTHSLRNFPAELTNTWQRWIGENRTNALLQANFTLFRKLPNSQPGNLDEEHQQLKQHVVDIFALLQLSGSVVCQSAFLLLGCVEPYGVVISQLGPVTNFYLTGGGAPVPVTQERLEEAVAGRRVREAMPPEPLFGRFKRGSRILVEGLAERNGAERLHQFVRALEALMIPPIYKTRRLFVRRAKMFTAAQLGTGYLLGQAYDMRSDVEHVHEVTRSLQFVPPAHREAFALSRTRQLQALACFAYRLIYAEPTLCKHFESDDSIRAFWDQEEAAIRRSFGRSLNVFKVA